METQHPSLPAPLPKSSNFGMDKVHDVQRICKRIFQQASVNLVEPERFRFTPHKLRHTFLKRAADKHGVQFAHQASRNVPIKEIFRYTKPSQEEIDEAVEELFGKT